MLKPKVGDMVRLKPQRVAAVSESGVFATDGSAVLFRWNEFDIEEILPRPLAVGDRVRTASPYSNTGTIKAIDGAWAWVFWKGAAHDTTETRFLTRVDDAP